MSRGCLKAKLPLYAAAFFSLGLYQTVHATTIDFDSQGFTGPSLFADAGAAQTLTINTVDGIVTFSGGAILTNTTNMPANQTSIYGTADFANPGYTNPLVISFQNSVTNFFLDVYNGNTVDVQYTVSDNAGNSSTFLLAPNLSGGTSQIGFAATGTIVSIFANPPGQDGACCAFDFFIDNINFNAPLPPDLQTTPVPAALPLMGSVLGVGGFIGWHRRRRHRAAARA